MHFIYDFMCENDIVKTHITNTYAKLYYFRHSGKYLFSQSSDISQKKIKTNNFQKIDY